VLKIKVPQSFAIIGAKFQESFLSQVVNRRRFAASAAQDTLSDNTRNQRLEPTYKFSPTILILRVEAIRQQLL
jgi:hypothetical protein